MPFPLARVSDGDWNAVRHNTDATAARLNPVLPQVQVSNSGTQSIGTGGSPTALTFNQEGFDNGELHSTSSNPTRLIAPITGLYMVGANVTWASNATGYRFMALRESAGSARIAADSRPTVNGDTTHQSCVTVWHFAAGTYFEVIVFQNSGGNLNVVANSASDPGAVAWMVRLGGYTNMGVA